MNGQDNGSGVTPTAAADKTPGNALTSYMLAALSVDPHCKVAVTTPCGYIEKSFTELTPEQILSVLSLWEITLTGTPWTTGAPISAGQPAPRTTETATAASGDNTASPFNLGATLKIGDEVLIEHVDQWFTIADLDIIGNELYLDRGPNLPKRWYSLAHVKSHRSRS